MGKSYPDPTPPKETAAASTSTNVSTAIANAYMGNVNQYTPDGSLEYNQTGTKSVYDPYTSATYDIPTWSATQTLSPQAQQTKNLTDQAQTNLAGIARDQSGRVADALGQPINLSNEAVEGRLFDLGRQRLDPLFAEKRAALDTKLANQGIGIGSKAYDTAVRQESEAQNDAYNQLLLGGRAQSVQEILAERNQPINETTALLSGSQVSQPNFVNAQMPTIPTTDTAGIIGQYDQARMQKAQAENAGFGNILGGLFGLGANLIASDRRLKKDIKRIGTADNGLPIYSYRYIWDGPVQIGFMADEVKEIHPEAVSDIGGGFLGVDYEKAVD